MTVYVALLRAIGPLTHAKMSMAALRAAAETAGFPGATTVGNTGNLLVSSELDEEIAKRCLQEVVDGFGIRSEVFIRSATELRELVKLNPFPEASANHPSAVGVCFFHTVPEWPEITSYDGPEAVRLSGRHLVVDYRGDGSASRINVEKRLGQSMTQRNWRVVEKLAAFAGAARP